MRRIFPFFLVLCLCCTFLLFPISASAQDVVHYASIPKPVSSDYVRYIVADNSSQNYPTIYRISVPELMDPNFVNMYLTCTATGVLDLYVQNGTGLSFNLVVERFSLSGTFIAVYNKQLSSDATVLNTILHFTYPNMAFIDPGTIPIADPDGLYNFGMPSIAWADETDPTVYTSWLSNLYNKLNELDSNTDNIESSLSSINSSLSLFYSLFNSYQSHLLQDTSQIILQLNNINTRLQSFQNQNHTDLVNIYATLTQIYDLLAQEQETQPPIEQESQIQDFIQAEGELNKDFSGDLQNQFNIAGNVFQDNSAYSFITNLMQSLVLSNVKINSLLIYALAIGLCVLVLGRKLNAG